jgi:Tol biopolymer transport system component
MKTAAVALAAASLLTVEQRDANRPNLDYPSSAVSADGAFVAFTSYSQLAQADGNSASDVYVLDRLRQVVTLESAGISGPSQDAAHPAISGDGRYLLFERGDNLVFRDRTAHTTQVLWAGRQLAISENGRVVVFAAESFDGAPDADPNGNQTDIYAVDMRDRTAHRVSVDLKGLDASATASVTPSISRDGRYVAFASRPKRADKSGHTSYVFVRDTLSQVTELVGPGWDPALSGDGRTVAFVGTSDGLSHIFLAEMQSKAARIITRSIRRGLANGSSVKPRMSSDGRFVVFQSEASDLVEAEDFNLLWDVFVFDRETGKTTRVSGDHDAAWMEPSSGPSIDSRGSVVVFSSRHPTDASDKKNDFDLYVATMAAARSDRRSTYHQPTHP